MMTSYSIFRKKNTANCYGEVSGTLISAQTAVWFGKLVLPRQTRYGDLCVPQLPVDVLRYAAACVCDSHEPTKF